MNIRELKGMKNSATECLNCRNNRNCIRSRVVCANMPVADVEVIKIIDELIKMKEREKEEEASRFVNYYAQRQILARTIRKNGVDIETTVAMEELSELIQAISKCKRYGNSGKYRDNLVEEIADVKIIIDELMLIYGITDNELSEWYNRKMERAKTRLSDKK